MSSEKFFGVVKFFFLHSQSLDLFPRLADAAVKSFFFFYRLPHRGFKPTPLTSAWLLTAGKAGRGRVLEFPRSAQSQTTNKTKTPQQGMLP